MNKVSPIFGIHTLLLLEGSGNGWIHVFNNGLYRRQRNPRGHEYRYQPCIVCKSVCVLMMRQLISIAGKWQISI